MPRRSSVSPGMARAPLEPAARRCSVIASPWRGGGSAFARQGSGGARGLYAPRRSLRAQTMRPAPARPPVSRYRAPARTATPRAWGRRPCAPERCAWLAGRPRAARRRVIAAARLRASRGHSCRCPRRARALGAPVPRLGLEAAQRSHPSPRPLTRSAPSARAGPAKAIPSAAPTSDVSVRMELTPVLSRDRRSLHVHFEENRKWASSSRYATPRGGSGARRCLRGVRGPLRPPPGCRGRAACRSARASLPHCRGCARSTRRPTLRRTASSSRTT